MLRAGKVRLVPTQGVRGFPEHLCSTRLLPEERPALWFGSAARVQMSMVKMESGCLNNLGRYTVELEPALEHLQSLADGILGHNRTLPRRGSTSD